MLGVFSLAAILSFLRFQKNNNPWTLNLHLLFWVLAILSKETAILLPLILVAFIPEIFNFKNFWKTIKTPQIIASILVWLTGAIFYLLFRFGAIGFSSTFNLSDLFVGFASGLKAMLIFFGKCFWPFNLSTLPINTDSSIWPGVIIFLALLTAAWRFRKKMDKPLFFFGLFWFFVFLTPSLIFQNNPEYGVAFNLDHHLYLPAVGLLISILSFPKISHRLIKTIPLTILIIALGFSMFRIKNYPDALSFWTQATKLSPSSAFAHNNLGVIYYLSGEKDKAVNEYYQAQVFNPKEKLVNNNIGLCLMDSGRFDLAKYYFEQELKINPGYDNAINNLQLLNYKEAKINKK